MPPMSRSYDIAVRPDTPVPTDEGCRAELAQDGNITLSPLSIERIPTPENEILHAAPGRTAYRQDGVSAFWALKSSRFPAQATCEAAQCVNLRSGWNLSRSFKIRNIALALHKPEGASAMATQIVMDHTGDSRHHFNPRDAKSLLKAEQRFKELTGSGFTAAVRTASGDPVITRRFDPTAEETLFYPRLVGG
jgi:hypothetical protein